MEGDRQIREMRSDFDAFFLSSGTFFFIYIASHRKRSRPRVLRNTTRKVRPCQIGDTLFGDCTRTLLSPSGVSEETLASPPKESRGACFRIPSIPPVPFHLSSSLLDVLLACATVSSTLDRNKKRRETINLDKNTTGLLFVCNVPR